MHECYKRLTLRQLRRIESYTTSPGLDEDTSCRHEETTHRPPTKAIEHEKIRCKLSEPKAEAKTTRPCLCFEVAREIRRRAKVLTKICHLSVFKKEVAVEDFEKVRDEELDVYRMSFEEFLAEEHAKQYNGLDDDMADDCEDWISMLEASDLMEYAEKYGKTVFKQGRKCGK
jgi:hypothetical protein